jgi:DNA modification methylase
MYGGDETEEIGREKTPEKYVNKLVAIFREVRRVLREDGTVWLNLGDSYGKGKQLQGVPWRVALTLQADGWILRSDIIWSKPDPIPTSVNDRPTISHEYIFLFSNSENYYYDAEAIKTPSKVPGDTRIIKDNSRSFRSQGLANGIAPSGNGKVGSVIVVKAMANKRTVWSIPTYSFADSHFATFPPDLIIPCVKAGTSQKGCCPHCGKCWKRILDKERRATRPGKTTKIKGKKPAEVGNRNLQRHVTDTKTIGWEQQCDCSKHDPVPCVVLDPFSGAATTGLVCQKLQRAYIGIELNPEYIEMSRKRLINRGDVKRPKKQQSDEVSFDIEF